MSVKINLCLADFFSRSQPFLFSKFVTGDEGESLASVQWLPDDDISDVL